MPLADAEDTSSIPGLGRFPGEGNGYPLQYSGLENSKDYIGHDWETFTFTVTFFFMKGLKC